MSTLYDEDFYSWAMSQARAVRAAGRLQLNVPLAVDWEHVAEEIEDLGKSERRELYKRYFRLLTHLLKWQYQPEHRSGSWRGTFGEQRRGLGRLLRESPGLKPMQLEAFTEAYNDARGQAADETGLPIETFPASCPHTLEVIMDRGFWPDGGDRPAED